MVGAQYPADKLPNGADMTDVIALFDAVAKLARASLTFIEQHRLVLRAGGVVRTRARARLGLATLADQPGAGKNRSSTAIELQHIGLSGCAVVVV